MQCRPQRLRPASATDALRVVAGLALFAGSPALAAAPGAPPATVTVTPRVLVPQSRPDDSAPPLPPSDGLRAPPGSDELELRLGDVVVDGGFGPLAQRTRPLLARLVGRPVRLGEVYAAASALEQAYAAAGHFLVRVSVPPQELAPGATLRLVVTDGFLEDIDLTGVPAAARGAVAASVMGLRGKPHLRAREVERALLLAGDVPGLALRSALERGANPGGTRLLLAGEFRSAGASLGLRNDYDPALGSLGLSAEASLNSPFGGGELLYGYVASGRDLGRLVDGTGRVRVLGGGALLRLARGALTLNPEATFSRTRPDPAPGAPVTLGRLERETLRLGYVAVRRRARTVVLTATLERTDSINSATDFDVDLSHDRFLAARLGLSASLGGAGRPAATLALRWNQGLGDLGARTAHDVATSFVPFSRQGAANDFSHVDAELTGVMPVAPALSLSLHVRAQSAFGAALLRTEQLSLEGADGLSAYVGGQTAVDSGAVARGELVASLPARTLGLNPYLFGAAGTGRIARPTGPEPSRVTAFALGTGLRAGALGGKLSLASELAFGFSRLRPLDRATRFNLTLGLSL
ncbi:ShlB/FhaC/HecB family hemolysin secretion/activation protein [Novosphingobium huizhouense]|uniref:ShlB/FhaC/HecB family hemolysin secretion/activation protein n=1 Tax=Novosphingobium huizhouense TaxID=2866625 RepID=UPI001CD90A40|nr:ShlB/FhaC/HecB family hemolysin secretion/activation protein [Novosphingobium huizhouense]